MKKQHIISNLIIVAVLVGLSALTLNFYSPLYVMAKNSPQPIYKGNTQSNKVALMINVYWGNEYIPSILNTLSKYGVKTTFFVGGSWVNSYPSLLENIAKEGHEIGNHGYFHKDHDKITSNANKEEIIMCQRMVEAHSGIATTLFAPPSGAFNSTTIKIANELGYKVIMWSKDTIDWRDKDADITFSRATKKVTGGDLILMHPTAHTAAALPRILEFYKLNNLSADTVSNVLA